MQAVALTGYVGAPELPPPDTRLIRLRGPVSAMDLASVVKTVNTLSKLGAEASIPLALELTLKGEVTNEHAVQMALKEIRGRVAGMAVEEVSRCAYPPSQVHLLTGLSATRDAILNALDTLAQCTEKDATVVVYSGKNARDVSSPTDPIETIE